MSEKRFKVINVRWQGKGEAVAFEDTQTNAVYFAENQEECERIVDLLNDQQTTIQKQSERIRELESTLADDIVRRTEIKDAWKQRWKKRWNDE